jgi:RecB family exonuclease
MATTPEEWPAPPKWWSFSSIREIGTCPRRWALKHAAYPSVWPGRGYPQRPSWPSVRGSLLHSCAERVVKLVASEHLEAHEAVRRLGGYPAMLSNELDQLLEANHTNPRYLDQEVNIRRTFAQDGPAMRRDLQRLISGLPKAASHPASQATMRQEAALGSGVYAEVDIRAPDLALTGRVDLLHITDEGASIVDFKTGAAHPEHERQLQLYALIWRKDSNLNPSGQVPSDLALRYSSGEVRVEPPDDAELTNLEEGIQQETSSAIDALRQPVPPAIPEPEKCRLCDVRHLCGAYWMSGIWRSEPSGGVDSHLSWFGDIDVQLNHHHGPRSWDAHLLTDANDYVEPVRIRFWSAVSALAAGTRLRVLGAQLQRLESSEPVTEVFVSRTTEWFIVP